jgi:hypothetical protein
MLWIAYWLIFCQKRKPSTQFATIIRSANSHVQLEEEPLQKDSSFFTTSQLQLITVNVLMIFGMTYATATLSFELLYLRIFLEYVFLL